MTLRATPTFLQAGSHPAENVRLMFQSVLGGETGAFAGGVGAFDSGHGVGRSGDLFVDENGTPNMSVNVAAGGAFVRNTDSSDGGVYHVYNDAPVNLVVTAADPSNARNDLVVVQVRDSEYAGSDDDAVFADTAGFNGANISFWRELIYPVGHPLAGASMDLSFVLTVPEPSTVAMGCMGLVALVGMVVRRRRNANLES